MRMQDLIAKKRDGAEHSPEEIRFISDAAARGTVPDYQLSAWLMAVNWRGMTRAETTALTAAMAASGRPLRRVGVRARVDKHSTGGVGDGVSLALAPLVAAAGLHVPMMSGRGLGHTGGTLDKLESMAGFRVGLKASEVEREIRAIGVSMFGQTSELAPADRKLYSLRDATATVECRPLVVASILSKKISERLDALVLDVKCGSGAIFERPAEAGLLAKAMIKTAKGLGLRAVALLTGMEQPLGRAIGNALELKQAVEVLHGDRSCPDYVELLLALGGWMVHLGGKARSWMEGAELLEEIIRDGSALRRFKQMVKSQGGDPRVVDDPERFLPRARLSRALRAARGGVITALDARLAGRSAVALGAGRDSMEDELDYGAGILLRRKLGDAVSKGEEIARLYASSPATLEAGHAILSKAVCVGLEPPRPAPVIRKVWR